jgi:hypothetical protein
MNKMAKNHIITVFITSLLFFSSAVHAISLLGNDDDPDVIWKSGVNLYFKYTEQDESGFGKNDHPVDLDEKDISNALQSLNIPDKSFFSSEVDIKPVFPSQQVKLLSENLSKGLKNAKPEQDIIFVMGKSYTKLHFLTERAFVTGRAFYKDGKLNLIIGDYDLGRNEALESVYDPSGKGDVPYTFNLGYRSKSSGFKQEIIQTAGVENKILAHERRQNWLMIDVKVAADAFIAKKNSNNKSNDTVNNAAIQKEAEQLARDRRQLRLEMAKMRKEMQEGTNKEGMNKEKEQLTTEERLGRLEELHKKKLITEDEYEQKRKEILDDI